MMSNAEQRLDSILQRKDPCGAYFFFGDATRLRDDAARELIDAALDPATRDFNLSRFSGESAEAETLASALVMPNALVVVEDIESSRCSTPSGSSRRCDRSCWARSSNFPRGSCWSLRPRFPEDREPRSTAR